MGMVLSIEAVGGTDAALAAADQMPTGHDGHDSAPVDTTVTADQIDLMAEPGPDAATYDPRLPPAPATRVHRVRLVVTEVEAEVAPGIRQTRWTFGGTAPGPVLRGKVGDTFIVTLVNDGSIGHSIDFHAGALAPDGPMRTIAPGETLEYRFTATRAGIWMYHCSTMPMSMHIANGMFGAVIIDPPDLAPVDREYVLVQSESYLGPPGRNGVRGEDRGRPARPGRVQRLPDAVRPRTAHGHRRRTRPHLGPRRRTEHRVCPSMSSEASSTPSTGKAPTSCSPARVARRSSGCSPRRAGSSNSSSPRPGTYPFVSHVMSDAEKGAHGLLRVTDAP